MKNVKLYILKARKILYKNELKVKKIRFSASCLLEKAIFSKSAYTKVDGESEKMGQK